MKTWTFDSLGPYAVVDAVESAFGLRLDGTLTSYPSYINRVFALRDEDGTGYVVKFYRPNRWNREAILEEHDFVTECAKAELPVVAPLTATAGGTLPTLAVTNPDAEHVEQASFNFALYPLRGGRNFDAEGDEEWLRLGSVVGRIHAVAKIHGAEHRLQGTPAASTSDFLEELRQAEVVHPECRDEFFQIAGDTIAWIGPLFQGVPLQRVHGDCHRGNILDRPGEGLMIIDFDDMMIAPAVQDLWLLLPDHVLACTRELTFMLEGYEQFCEFDRQTLRLIEPLRFMRMIYYLAWSARQREDLRFKESFPAWGSEAFWIKEIEDLRSQLLIIRKSLE